MPRKDALRNNPFRENIGLPIVNQNNVPPANFRRKLETLHVWVLSELMLE